MVEHMNELRERTNTAIHSFKVDDFDLSERDDDDAHHDVQLDAIFAYHAPGAFVAPPAVPSNAADANALLTPQPRLIPAGAAAASKREHTRGESIFVSNTDDDVFHLL